MSLEERRKEAAKLIQKHRFPTATNSVIHFLYIERGSLTIHNTSSANKTGTNPA
jgi:hypothetical protein